jgi:hypothetical protein
VYEVGTFGDEVYVAMEFVDGVTLRAWQFEQARTWRDVLRIYQAAGRGLAAAHGRAWSTATSSPTTCW